METIPGLLPSRNHAICHCGCLITFPSANVSRDFQIAHLAHRRRKNHQILSESVPTQPELPAWDGPRCVPETLPRRNRLREDGRSATAESPAPIWTCPHFGSGLKRPAKNAEQGVSQPDVSFDPEAARLLRPGLAFLPGHAAVTFPSRQEWIGGKTCLKLSPRPRPPGRVRER